MNEFIKILLSLSVSGTLLLLLIWGLKPFYKNKFSRRWQYYIWLIVALRFLLPFTPDTTVVGSLFEKFGTAVAANETTADQTVPLTVNADNSEAEPIPANKDMASTSTQEPFPIYVCLFFIWSALALILFVHKITMYQGFTQYIKAGNTELSDIKTLNLLSDCEEKLHIKTRVELSYNPLIVSPIMIGFFRPRIVLPDGGLEEKELSYIFMHELIHYRQKDLFYKWLIQIVVCVHWFNPFVYLLAKEINKSCELSCDEKAISMLDKKSRREYGDTLIRFLKPNNPYKSSLASVTLTEGAEQLKERLGAIMKFKKKSKSIIAITAIFSAAACVCFLVIGAYAAPSALTQEETEPERKTEADNDNGPGHSASYEKLIAYKTKNYPQQSIASFNAALASTPDELTELLAAQADVINEISPNDENYDFYTTTLQFSANELYCGHMGEELTFFAGISKQSRPSKWPDEDGEIWYEFHCHADLYVGYSISSPEHVTVAERDTMLLTFKEEMQRYLDSLSENEITDGAIKAKLADKAAELISSLSTENMELLSCDISIEISDSGIDNIQ